VELGEDQPPRETFRMDNLLRKNWLLIAISVLLFASTSFGYNAGDTVSITFGAGSGVALGGVYVDPYTANINGVTTTVLCDDFKDEGWSGETWTATVNDVYTLTNLPVAPLFGTSLGAGQQTLYSEAAWLATQILANPAQEGIISFALWELTYCSTSSIYSGGGCLEIRTLLSAAPVARTA